MSKARFPCGSRFGSHEHLCLRFSLKLPFLACTPQCEWTSSMFLLESLVFGFRAWLVFWPLGPTLGSLGGRRPTPIGIFRAYIGIFKAYIGIFRTYLNRLISIVCTFISVVCTLISVVCTLISVFCTLISVVCTTATASATTTTTSTATMTTTVLRLRLWRIQYYDFYY